MKTRFSNGSPCRSVALAACAALAAVPLLCTIPTAAHADDSFMGVPDSGLKDPIRLSIGQSTSLYDNGYSFSLSDLGLHITTVKLDYSFYRPRWSEAMVSLWYTHSHFNDGFGDTANGDAGTLTGEYRLRFGGHGIGYVGLGGGESTEGLVTNGAQFVITGALGVDLGHFFVEWRDLNYTSDNAGLENIFIGGRF
jgi:hypothetical protein